MQGSKDPTPCLSGGWLRTGMLASSEDPVTVVWTALIAPGLLQPPTTVTPSVRGEWGEWETKGKEYTTLQYRSHWTGLEERVSIKTIELGCWVQLMHWKKIWKAGVIDHQFMAKCESQRSSLAAKRFSLVVRGQKKKKNWGSGPELNYKGSRALGKIEFSTTVSQLNQVQGSDWGGKRFGDLR